MDDLTQRIVEAAARAFWGEGYDNNPHLHDAIHSDMRAALSAALALAEQEGVIFTRVPGLEEPDPAMSPSIQHWADGYNAHRAATLAGKVKL